MAERMIAPMRSATAKRKKSCSRGMGKGKRGDDGNERAEAAERNHKTEQKQKVVGAIEDVEKTEVDKAQRRLMPPRIETNQAGIAVEFERAAFTAGRNEAQNGDNAQAQARKARLNGKARDIGLNWRIEQHVQQGLVPIDIRGTGQ